MQNIFDNSVRPQDDFFGYVNNNWLKNNPIPANESRWGTFYELRNNTLNNLHAILDGLSVKNDNELNHDQKLLKTFYTAGLSYSKNRVNQLKRLDDELNIINNINDKSQLPFVLGQLHLKSFGPFWSPYVGEDDKNSDVQLLRLYQDGLRLPNRDYYLDDTDHMKQIRNKYSMYFSTVNSKVSGVINWDTIFGIELKLANASWTDIELRDIEKGYNRFSLYDLGVRFPSFDWNNYFKGLGWINPKHDVIVDQPSFIDESLKIISESKLEDIKMYLAWQVKDSLFKYIDEESTIISFDFYGKEIDGKKEINPLWKRIIINTNDLIIGESLGKEYCSKHFPESSKHMVTDLVEDIRLAFHKRIDQVVWMNNESKKCAHKKLDNIRLLMGYPTKWHNLEKLEFSPDNYLGNIMSAKIFKSNIQLEKIGKKPDDEDWKMNPQTVNAYSDLNQLVICFPAAILQPPFFNPDATYATNLGGIGAVIGHEFTHSFDDQGSKFDDKGNMNPWLTKKETDLFKQLAKNIVKQADSYEVIPGIHLKGKLILGEVIADIGGFEIAIEALRLQKLQDFNKSLSELFINEAVCERGADRDEFAIQLAKTDPHPPAAFRVNCTVGHVDAFYDAFDVTESDKLYISQEKRAHIW